MPVTVRDPVWGTIQLDDTALRVVDTPAFQRLRYIKQLGLAHLVYPGATHTRFDHALGVYHLATRALAALDAAGALDGVDASDRALIPLAALLHDIGHYPFSHALEELEQDRIPGHHETVAGVFLGHAGVRSALESVADDGVDRVAALIRGRSHGPLQGLVSGSLDLDKIEYLKRDSRFCGVPVGEVDVDRLLYALDLVRDPETGRAEVGVHEKGVAALESLLFGKYQMFRNVYWHHAVRAATVMYKRLVSDALEAGLVAGEELLGTTDEALLHLLETRAAAGPASRPAAGGAASGPNDPNGGSDAGRDDAAARVGAWVRALRSRDLPKRAVEVAAAELGGESMGDWLISDSPLKRRVEDALAAELGLWPGAAFLDYPAKAGMFGLDLLVRRRSGEVLRLGPAGRPGLIRLPQVAAELYQTARVLRLFTWGARRTVAAAALLPLVTADAAEVRSRLDSGGPLLAAP